MKALCDQGRTDFVRASLRPIWPRCAPPLRLRPPFGQLRDASLRQRGIDAVKRGVAALAGASADVPVQRGATAGAIPDGTYESTMTAADVKRARRGAGDVLYCRPADPPPTRHSRPDVSPLLHGSANGHTQAEHGRDVLRLIASRFGFATTGETLLPFSWSFDGRTLRFFDLPFHGGGYYGAVFTPLWTKTH